MFNGKLRNDKQKSFTQIKKELRAKHKWLKAGAKKMSDFSAKDQASLKKYYGW